MKQAHRKDAEFRHGTWGPAYLLKSDSVDVGVVRLEPGQSMDNHYHALGEETFIVTSGQLTVWLDTKNEHVLEAGAVMQCDRAEMHLVANNSTEVCEFYFLKTPPVAGDTTVLSWQPGETPLAPISAS